MHFGRSNQARTYSVNGRVLGRVIEQRDRGVQVESGVTGGQGGEEGIGHACFHWSQH